MPRTASYHIDCHEQVLIPAGPFLFGEDLEERYLPPFSIDRYPVTIAAYAKFAVETRREPPKTWLGGNPPEDRANHPVTGVSYFDAAGYADWLGRRLPLEEQWEKAARGTDERAYPWGDRFNVRNLNSRAAKKRGTTAVDRYTVGASPFGVMDMAGNVWEMTESWFDNSGDLKVLKGGCFALTKEYALISCRHFNDPAFGNNLTGFRTILPL